ACALGARRSRRPRPSRPATAPTSALPTRTARAPSQATSAASSSSTTTSSATCARPSPRRSTSATSAGSRTPSSARGSKGPPQGGDFPPGGRKAGRALSFLQEAFASGMAPSRLGEEPRAQCLAEILGHQVLDQALDREPRLLAGVDEADAHAGLVAFFPDPGDLARQDDRLVQGGYTQPKDEARPHGQGLGRFDECPALGDVPRVVGEEGVELRVVHPQLDGNPGMGSPVYPDAIHGVG